MLPYCHITFFQQKKNLPLENEGMIFGVLADVLLDIRIRETEKCRIIWIRNTGIKKGKINKNHGL